MRARAGFTSESRAKIARVNRAAFLGTVAPAAKGWTADLVGRLRQRTNRGTGRMAGSWLGTVTSTGAAVSVRVGNVAGYSGYVERGTRPHVIEPRTAKVLFWRPGRGRVSAFRAGPAAFKGGIFARRVQHPGTAPQWIFRDTLADSRGRFWSFLRYQLVRAGLIPGAAA
jgi:hypothetical protein